jgi:hypothetical protein
MSENQYLRARTNQILRDRIALGMTFGGSKSRKRRATSKRRVVKRRGSKRMSRRAGDDMYDLMAAGVMAGCDGMGVTAGRRRRRVVKRRGSKRMGSKRMTRRRAPVRRAAGRRRKAPVRRRRAAGSKSRRHTKRRAGVSAGRGGASPWITFVKKFAKHHNISYKDALMDASAAYRRGH